MSGFAQYRLSYCPCSKISDRFIFFSQKATPPVLRIFRTLSRIEQVHDLARPRVRGVPLHANDPVGMAGFWFCCSDLLGMLSVPMVAVAACDDGLFSFIELIEQDLKNPPVCTSSLCSKCTQHA